MNYKNEEGSGNRLNVNNINSTSAPKNDNEGREASVNELYVNNSVPENINNHENTSAPLNDVDINNYENTVAPGNNNVFLSAPEKQCSICFNNESNCQSNWQSSDAEINELYNGLNNTRTTVNRSLNNSYGPEWMSTAMSDLMCFIECIFIFKYLKKDTDTLSYLHKVYNLTVTDLRRIYNADRKSNCTICQYCCFLTFLNCFGGMMPPTPSPYSSPNISPTKANAGRTPPSTSTLTERQYHCLYRDFKYASQCELRDQLSSSSEIIDENNQPVNEEMREIIDPFTNEVFPTLVDDYLKLFEEMVKGLILLKETGISLEDICSIGEESHNYYCEQTTSTINTDTIVSSCRPYNLTEFEKLLRHELKSQFESSIHDITKCSHKMFHQKSDSTFDCKKSQTCGCEQAIPNNNPYLTFLTEINCHNPRSYNTEEFDHILQREKKMYLINCLKLLRENEYFRSKSQSSIKKDNLFVNINQNSLPKSKLIQEDINETEMNNISFRIYNQTICHVQSAILAIFRSMNYGKQEDKTRFISPKTDKTKMQIAAKINQSKNLIEKSLSQYLMTASTEDDVFVNESLNTDSSVQDNGCTMPSIKYDDEVKYCLGQYNTKQLSYVPTPLRYSYYKAFGKAFPPVLQDLTQQHPNLKYAKDAKTHTNKGLGINLMQPSCNATTQTTKTDLPLKNEQENVANTGLAADKIDDAQIGEVSEKIHECPIKTTHPLQENKESRLNKLLFKKKNNDVRVSCVLNYLNAEVSHIEAITFLKKIETEGGSFHYPHCSENTSLIKIEGPSVFLSVSCADCHQELAPPQKLIAFKSECENTNRSKLMAYIIRKTRASFYLPVRCGGCGCLLCDREKGKKHILVPFHSPVKGYICAARMRSHECHTSSINIEYTGCISDETIMAPGTPKISEKRGQSYEHLKSPNQKCMTRSRSLPVLVDENQDTPHYSSLRNDLLKFEDAISNILNIWTYEMINYEKAASSVQLRSQILNYRKSLSLFIKKDIQEKLYYRHILSVFKRIENFESPILEFKDNNIATQTNTLNCKIIKSHSYHSKLNETTSATRRSKSEYMVRNDFLTQINTFNHTLSELEKDAGRLKTFNDEIMRNEIQFKKSRQFESEALELNNNIISTRKNIRELFDPDKSKTRHVSKYQILDRKNIARPVSLHSELKQKTPISYRRRSCSFEAEAAYKTDFSSQINAWKYELKELQKSAESPHLKTEGFNRKNMSRPLSFHSELKQQTLVTHRRRRSSASFASESGYKDLSTEIKAWKIELLNLQKGVQSPHYASASRKNVARPLSLHSELKEDTPAVHLRRSCSFATESASKGDVSSQINVWKNELINLQKSVQSPHLETEIVSRENNIKASSLGSHLDPRHTTTSRTKTKLVMNDKKSSQRNSQEDEFQFPKCVGRPHFRHDKVSRQNIIKNDTSHSMPKHATTETTCRPKSDLIIKDRFSFEINPKDESLHRDITFDTSRALRQDRNKITRDNSLHKDPIHSPTAFSRHRQSEPILNKEFSTALNAWKHKLLELEKDVKSPHLRSEMVNRKNKRTVSLDSEPKRIVTADHTQTELDDSLSELKTWNHRLRQLEKDATSPQSQSERQNRKIKIRAVSLHEDYKHTTAPTSRPKSESVLDDFSSELISWKHTLFKLEEDAGNPQPVVVQRRPSIAKSHSLNSEHKYRNNAIARRVNTDSLNIKDDTSRRNSLMTPMTLPVEPNTHASTNMPEYIPSVRRYSATPRQLPSIPNTSRPNRRHSHYETTGNFVHLLTDRKETRLNTHEHNTALSKGEYSREKQGVHQQDKTSNAYLQPCSDEGIARSRFFSQ